MSPPDIAPTDKAAALRDVTDALQKSDVNRATDIAREALSRGFEHPLFLNLRAFWLETNNDDAASHRDLLRARELAPDDVPILNALGLSWGRNGYPREAVECFDRVIALQPDFGPAYFNKGWTSEQMGELVMAREAFQRAITLMPKSGGPLAHMASILTRFGQWTAAKSYAEQALALEPNIPKAEMTLASVDQTTGHLDLAEQRLRRLIARQDMASLDRAHALGQLGDILDVKNEVAEAFHFYQASNDVTRQMHASRYESSTTTSIRAFLAWMIGLFEKGSDLRWIPAEKPFPQPGAPAQHAFLLGFPRSGTTLLEQVLESHPGVTTSGERDTLSDSLNEFMQEPEEMRRLAELRGATLSKHRRLYWEKVRGYGFDVGGRVFIDKQPMNTVNLPVITKLFPDAKILFAIRDPRDVVFSCFRRRFQINPSNFELLSLESVARYYDRVMYLADLYRERLPMNLMDLRHERLVEDFEGQVRKVCDFIGVPWNDTMRDFAEHSKSRAIATPSATQVTRGINREGMDHWRRYAKELAPVLPILAPWVKRYSYASD